MKLSEKEDCETQAKGDKSSERVVRKEIRSANK
jgi:hypothetical protein